MEGGGVQEVRAKDVCESRETVVCVVYLILVYVEG
jgi:hypothetical protein